MIDALISYTLKVTNITSDGLVANLNSTTNDYVSLIIPIAVSIIAAVVGAIVTIIVSRSQNKQQSISAEYQRKQHELTGIIEAFKILNNDAHRQARMVVYDGFDKYEKRNKVIFDVGLFHTSAAMVMADFDEIGMLTSNDLIPKDKFLSSYWNTVMLCWISLKDYIANERVKRDYLTYMSFFEKLYIEAEKYAKTQGIEIDKVKPY